MKNQWKTEKRDDGFWSITDNKGVERFRGRTEELLVVFLAEYMKNLELARKAISKLKEERKDLKRRCGDDISKPTKKCPYP